MKVVIMRNIGHSGVKKKKSFGHFWKLLGPKERPLSILSCTETGKSKKNWVRIKKHTAMHV